MSTTGISRRSSPEVMNERENQQWFSFLKIARITTPIMKNIQLVQKFPLGAHYGAKVPIGSTPNSVALGNVYVLFKDH